jgi:hypothetical protein
MCNGFELKSEGEHKENKRAEQGEENEGSEDLGEVVTVHALSSRYTVKLMVLPVVSFRPVR